MLYTKRRAVTSNVHSKHINALCRQNVEFFNIEPGGAQSNHGDLKD